MLSNSVVSDYLCDPLDCCHPRSSVYGIFQAIILATAKSPQSCPTLCDPIDGSPAGSPIPGILQARTLEWVAISFSNAWKWKVKVKSCPTLSNPMDCSLPGSSAHGIFQARVLEWGAIGVGCHWSGVLFPPPGIFLTQRMNSLSPVSPAVQVDSVPLSNRVSPWLLRFQKTLWRRKGYLSFVDEET